MAPFNVFVTYRSWGQGWGRVTLGLHGCTYFKQMITDERSAVRHEGRGETGSNSENIQTNMTSLQSSLHEYTIHFISSTST